MIRIFFIKIERLDRFLAVQGSYASNPSPNLFLTGSLLRNICQNKEALCPQAGLSNNVDTVQMSVPGIHAIQQQRKYPVEITQTACLRVLCHG